MNKVFTSLILLGLLTANAACLQKLKGKAGDAARGLARAGAPKTPSAGGGSGNGSGGGSGSGNSTGGGTGEAHLVFTTLPGVSQIPGVAFTPAPQVTIIASDGTVASTLNHNILITDHADVECATNAPGNLLGATVQANNGIAIFSNLRYSQSGIIYIKASDATDAAIESTCLPIAIGVGIGPAAKVKYFQQPSTAATAGVNFAQQPIVRVLDAGDNVVLPSDAYANSAITLSVFSDAACTTAVAAGVLTGSPANAAAGVANFSAVSYTIASTIYLKAAIVGSALATDCSNAINVAAGSIDHLIKILGDNQTGVVNNVLPIDLTVKAVDAFNNPIANHLITFSSALGGVLTPTSMQTNAMGVAYSTFRLGNIIGVYNVVAASSVMVIPTANFTEIATAGPPAKLAFSVQPVARQTINHAFFTQPIVQVQDQYGNIVTSPNFSVALQANTNSTCSTAAGGALANATLNSMNGLATFAGVSYNQAAAIYIKAAAGSLQSACSNLVTVYNTLSLAPAAVTVEGGTSYVFEAAGGVPPLSFNINPNNSGASLMASYTGGTCPAGKTCVRYTAGVLPPFPKSDALNVVDSAMAVANTAQSLITVTAPPAPFIVFQEGASYNYGIAGSANITADFHVVNQGNLATSVLLAAQITGSSLFQIAQDQCAGQILAINGSCLVRVTFAAQSQPASLYTGSLSVSMSSPPPVGGTATIALSGEVDASRLQWNLGDYDSAQDVDVDADGNMYVAGRPSYVISFTPQGNFRWMYGGTDPSMMGASAAYFNKIAVKGGFVYAVGTTAYPVAGGTDAFVVKLDATSGNMIWQYTMTGQNGGAPSGGNDATSVRPHGISVDDSGNIFVAGRNWSCLTNSLSTGPFCNDDHENAFAFMLNSGGSLVWARDFPSGFLTGGSVYRATANAGDILVRNVGGASEIVMSVDSQGWLDQIGVGLLPMQRHLVKLDPANGAIIAGSEVILAGGTVHSMSLLDTDPIGNLMSGGFFTDTVVQLNASMQPMWTAPSIAGGSVTMYDFSQGLSKVWMTGVTDHYLNNGQAIPQAGQLGYVAKAAIGGNALECHGYISLNQNNVDMPMAVKAASNGKAYVVGYTQGVVGAAVNGFPANGLAQPHVPSAPRRDSFLVPVRSDCTNLSQH